MDLLKNWIIRKKMLANIKNFFILSNHYYCCSVKLHSQVKIGVQCLYGLHGATHKGAALLLKKFAHL